MEMMPEGDPNAFTRVLYGCDVDEISDVVVLTPITEMLSQLRVRTGDAVDCTGFNEGFNGSMGGRPVSVFNSRVGSPVAVDCTYYLRFTPCRSIIYLGLIGALQPDIKVGDIIVPTAALRGEGASKYFAEEQYPAVADFHLLKDMSMILDEVYDDYDVDVHYGPIFTTDAFAAETKEFLEHWSSRNLLGIEMETSAIYVIASLYRMRAVAIHVVSDNPLTKKSFFDPLSEAEVERRGMCTSLLMDAVERLVTSL